MTRANFTTKEIEGIVKTWSKGGAYVSVPSAWQGKRVKITVLEQENGAINDINDSEL
jgi:hypothetical protein